MGQKLTDEEKRLRSEKINKLIKPALDGDNEDWKQLYIKVEGFVHWIALKRLNQFVLDANKRSEWEEELFQAGWRGFLKAMKRYDEASGADFTSYAYSDISGAMSEELKFLLNSYGIGQSNDEVELFSQADFEEVKSKLKLKPVEKYGEVERIMQIQEVLRMQTDENHTLTPTEIGKHLTMFRARILSTYTKEEKGETISNALKKLILAVNPDEVFSEKNKDDYRILYKGMKDDSWKKRFDKAAGAGDKPKKQVHITDYSYVHVLDNKSLDQTIRAVALSELIDSDDKEKIIRKLIDTASVHYNSNYYKYGKLTSDPKEISGQNEAFIDNISRKLDFIQSAIHEMVQIKFTFEKYTEDGKKVSLGPKEYVMSPYRIVRYHDKYYCVGGGKDSKLLHYQIDLIEKLSYVLDEEGKKVPVEIIDFYGNPFYDGTWNPGRYLSEHLYMAYDVPREIKLRMKEEYNTYTMLHDWFMDNYQVSKDAEDDAYVIVKVVTSPVMMVHWAMQYGSKVEVLDEKVREGIKLELKKMGEIYGEKYSS